MLICHLYIYKVSSVQILPIDLIELFDLLLLNFKSSFIFCIQVLYQLCFSKYFLPVCGLSFHMCSYLSAYGSADVLGLMKSNLAIFLSWIVLLVLYLKSHHQTQGNLDRLLLCFIVLHFTFRSLIHFDVTSDRYKVCLYFFPCRCSFVPAPAIC